ncbi:hypothetical protein T06_1964 [Trichinella sp. T6]|nr:hypothetical protein T06_1964 [Trichinella sp. T6]
MLLYLYGEWKLSGTSDPEEEEVSISLATPSAARLLLYSYVQRNLFDVQDNTTQYLEEVWVACALYELRITVEMILMRNSHIIKSD